MSTCNDCYHCEVCHRRINGIDFLPITDGKINYRSIMLRECNDVENHCEYFKDKSTIIDLPCKVGDTVYYIYPIMHSIREDRCFVKQIIVNEISLDINGIRIFDELGIDHDLERIYFTKEEAEKELEGLKNG